MVKLSYSTFYWCLCTGSRLTVMFYYMNLFIWMTRWTWGLDYWSELQHKYNGSDEMVLYHSSLLNMFCKTLNHKYSAGTFMVSHTKRSHTLNAISKDVHCFYHNPAFHYTRVYTAGQHISVRQLPKVINVLRINFETYGIYVFLHWDQKLNPAIYPLFFKCMAACVGLALTAMSRN